MHVWLNKFGGKILEKPTQLGLKEMSHVCYILSLVNDRDTGILGKSKSEFSQQEPKLPLSYRRLVGARPLN